VLAETEEAREKTSRRTSHLHRRMSAFGGKADMTRA
jgi:hypothetical protein